jgi:NAD-dependent dihydropyrimidine dehydrogenase PreA subunit
MAFKITKACTNCGACLNRCPTGSISMNPLLDVIDADTCHDHAACVAVCPVDAIQVGDSRLALLQAQAPSAPPKSGSPKSPAKTPSPAPQKEEAASGSLEAILKEYDLE